MKKKTKKQKKAKKYYLFKSYLDDGEKILHVAHKHIVLLKVKGAKTSFFGITLPVILFLLFPSIPLVWGIWIFIGLCGVFYNFMDWYFDAWLLTNYGVISLEGEGIFDVTATRVEYHMIEGISYSIKGFWRNLLNFGDITLDKLGAKTSMSLQDAASPQKLERIIMDYQQKFVSDRSIRDHQALKDMLADMIAYHVHNNKIDKSDKKTDKT